MVVGNSTSNIEKQKIAVSEVRTSRSDGFFLVNIEFCDILDFIISLVSVLVSARAIFS
jgi:hypothetical protein